MARTEQGRVLPRDPSRIRTPITGIAVGTALGLLLVAAVPVGCSGADSRSRTPASASKNGTTATPAEGPTGAAAVGESAPGEAFGASDAPSEIRRKELAEKAERDASDQRERARAALKGTVVLHIGDSFLAAGLAQSLKLKMNELGVRYEARSKQSSYTTSWAGKTERLVQDTQPDLVLVTLGTNEITNTEPIAHAPHVKRIIKGIGGRPCVWITPPLWRKDTGIIDVIRVHSAPCRFFDSDALLQTPIARQADKIHPSPAGGAAWADAVWKWLNAERAWTSDSKPWALKIAPSEEHVSKGYVTALSVAPEANQLGAKVGSGTNARGRDLERIAR